MGPPLLSEVCPLPQPLLLFPHPQLTSLERTQAQMGAAFHWEGLGAKIVALGSGEAPVPILETLPLTSLSPRTENAAPFLCSRQAAGVDNQEAQA